MSTTAGLKRRAPTVEQRLPLFRPAPISPRQQQQGRRRYNVQATICIVILVIAGVFVGSNLSEVKPKIHPQPFHRHYPYAKEWYTPRLLDNVPLEAWDKGPLIHVVHTRFMQEQGNLTALGHARLGLFRVFCLPTLIQQSTDNFIWIIKIDPDLDPEIMQKLVDWLTPYPHFYLVGSNVNFRINEDFPGGWRGGAQGRDLHLSKLYTGNQTVLEHAMALEAQLPVLETRLDADDGLHLSYLQIIQTQAMENVFSQPHIQWMYWCSRRNLDWHWVDQDNYDQAKKIAEFGAIEMIQHQNFCVTPGITTGFPIGTPEPTVPVFGHQELVSELRKSENNCGQKECILFVEQHSFEAVRSRSATSAGMLKIDLEDGIILRQSLTYTLWDILYKNFGIQRNQVRWMNQYLTEHALEIAKDNLRGQCTLGHSCKDSARKHLEEIVEYYANKTATKKY